ncbi:MAG: DUF935 family protein [Proteobacteria bacterium]|nr:DUF935 family protein [Pseudomonadota bacterium]
MQELRIRNQSQQIYTRAISSAWRNNIQLNDPSLWQFRDPEVEEKMLRDADIRHAVGYRRHLIAGKDWHIVPADAASARAPMAVEIATELVKGIEGFTQSRMNLARAFFSGARFARIHGEPRVLRIGDGKPRTWWVPTRLEDTDKRMYRIVPQNDDGELSAHWERWDVGEVTFAPESKMDALHTIKHVYQDDEATLGYGSALREALGWCWYAKEHVFQESLAAVEKFAQGILVAKIDGARDAKTDLPNNELIEDWTGVLEDLRARHVLVFDKSDEVEILPGGGEGWQTLETMRAELCSKVYTLILGANLTTAASDGGSYALAEVQENSTEALIQFDRETLQETLSKSLIGCLWFRNHANLVELGIDQERPLFNITQEKRQDPKERAEVASTLSAMGVDLPLNEVLEQTGFSAPEEGEPIIPGGSGVQPFGGGLSDFGLAGGETAAPVDVQDTALNGAQVQAATDIIDRVVRDVMPADTAIDMLITMFNLQPDKARRMVEGARTFEPVETSTESTV